MSGHRLAKRKPTRAGARSARMQRELDAAPTIEAQLNLAFDWWRSAARHQPDRDDRILTLAHQLANEAHAMDGD